MKIQFLPFLWWKSNELCPVNNIIISFIFYLMFICHKYVNVIEHQSSIKTYFLLSFTFLIIRFKIFDLLYAMNVIEQQYIFTFSLKNHMKNLILWWDWKVPLLVMGSSLISTSRLLTKQPRTKLIRYLQLPTNIDSTGNGEASACNGVEEVKVENDVHAM